MGTKRDLAATVADVIASARDGPILDAFSGMCSVAQAVGQSRQIYTNDAQAFAYRTARALFVDNVNSAYASATAPLLERRYIEHFEQLKARHSAVVDLERVSLAQPDFISFNEHRCKLKRRIPTTSRRDHDLFTTIYADTYVGVEQAMQIDAIVCSLDDALHTGLINRDYRYLFLLGLGRAMARVSTTTGHFAQYLKPSERNHFKFVSQRRRCVWTALLESITLLRPIGTPQWRRANRSYHEESLNLLHALADAREDVGVIYADPPYTQDHYSRYYHLLETLIYYDYPGVTGKGRYRPGRLASEFCLRRRVGLALDRLIASARAIGCDLVLSYPVNGLAEKSGLDVRELILRHYPQIEVAHVVNHQHSTMGASNGAARSSVIEQIFMGRI